MRQSKKTEDTCVTDEWLYRHMPAVDQAIVSALESETDKEWEFSGNFQKKMERLAQKERHFSRWRRAQKAAAVFALLCVLGGLCVVVPGSTEKDEIPAEVETFVYVYPHNGKKIEYWFREGLTYSIHDGQIMPAALPLKQYEITEEEMNANRGKMPDEEQYIKEHGPQALTEEERSMKYWTDEEIAAYVDKFWEENGDRLREKGITRE